MVTYDSDKEGAREEALQEAEEEGKYTGGSDVDVIDDTDNDTSSTGSDDSTTVVVPESPAERDRLQEQEGDYTLGQGSTNEQAIEDAADNPSFDADQDTQLGAEERRQDTNQPLANPENSRPEEIQEAAQEIAASERFRGTRTGRQAGSLAQRIENMQTKNTRNIRNPSPEPVENRFDPLKGYRNRNQQTQQYNDIEPLNEVRDAATDLDNYLTTQATQSQKEISRTARRARKANVRSDNIYNPAELAARTFAGFENVGSEVVDVTEGKEFDPLSSENKAQANKRAKELQGDIGAATAPIQRPLQTGNLLASSLGRIFTDELARDEEQKAEDISPGKVVEFGEATVEQAAKDPTSFALTGALGFGLEKTTSTAVRTGVDTGPSTLRKVGAKADPATGIGRTPRPGEQTPTTPERIRAKADSATDFLKGDIKPEVNRKPEARNVIMDTDPDGVRFENQEVIEERVPDPSQISSEADDVVLDERGNVPVEVFERNRRDAVRDFLKDSQGEIKGITTTSKGQTRLVEPDLDTTKPDTPSGRVSDDFLDNRLRQPDSDSRPTLRDRMDADSKGRRRQTEFNKPKADTASTSGLGLGVGAGLGAEQDLDEPQKPVQPQDQDQKPEEIIDKPLKQDQTPEQKFPETKDSENPFLLQPPKDQPEDKPPRIRDRDISRRKSPDFGSEDEGFDMPDEEGDDFVGFENEGEFATSLTASLFDIEADEEFNEEQTFTGFEVRPLQRN